MLLAMDKEVAAAAAGPYKHMIPSSIYAVPSEMKGKKAVDPHVHNAFRKGQFNTVATKLLGNVLTNGNDESVGY